MRFATVLCLLVSFVGCTSESTEVATKSNRRVVRAFQDPALVESAELKSVSVKVTGMMCPHGCLPEVKSILTKKNDIESIELTPQLKEDVIDNPVILVKYRGELDKDATTKAIMEAGFENVEYTDL